MLVTRVGILFANGTYLPDMRVFHRTTRIVQEASWFIDCERWMTFQFELGYTAKDIFRVDEAERWLTKFVKTIDETESLRLYPIKNRSSIG
jgi:hypothetical protein